MVIQHLLFSYLFQVADPYLLHLLPIMLDSLPDGYQGDPEKSGKHT
jgi:hypothetical protein